MSVDELAEKTTIDFPKPIGRESAEGLLCYLSSHLPANVSGKIEYFISYRYDSKKESSFEDKGTLKLVASVNNLKGLMASNTFISERDGRDTSLISRIAFQRVPGWDLSDYRSEVRELWDDVRKVVNQYFEGVLKVGN